MVRSRELRNRAWNALKGKYWYALLAILVIGLLLGFGGGFAAFGTGVSEIVNVMSGEPLDENQLMGLEYLSKMGGVAAFIGLICKIFVNNPANVGKARFFTQLTECKPAFGEVFYGYKNGYKRNIWVLFLADIKLALWFMLLIVPGVIKSFEYCIIPYILADEPELSSKEVFAKAHDLMMGNKWRYFKLMFSFIGWELLGSIALGLGLIFLPPYTATASAEFYQQIKLEKAAA